MAPLSRPQTFDSSDSDSSDSDLSLDSKTLSSGKLPKLIDDGKINNYGEWKIQCQTEIRSLGLWKYIEGPDSKPPVIPPLQEDTYMEGSDDEGNIKTFHVHGNAKLRKQKIRAAKPWMQKNDILLNKLFRSMSGTPLHFVTDITYAAEVWDVLHSHYQPVNSSLAVSIRSDLQGYRCTPLMDVNDWLNDMHRIYHSLIEMSPGAMSDREFALLTINNLPLSGGNWDSFTKGLRERINQYDNSVPRKPVRSIEFISAIRQEYIICNRDNPDVTAQIFSARVNADNKASKRPRPPDNVASSSSPSKRVRSDKTCTNSNCGRKGHEISECITFGGGDVGNYPNWWKGPFNLHLQPKSCSRANNVAPSTHPAFARTQAAAQTQASSAPKANLFITPDSTAVDSFSSSSDAKIESTDIVLMSCVNDDPVVTTLPVWDPESPKTDVCYFDSGANRHVFNNQSLFESYQSITPIDVQGVGTNCLTKAIGRGNVRLRTSYGTKNYSILLADVLHIPRARSNLISGGQFDERGVHTSLGDGKSSFFYHGLPFLDGFLKNRLYHLNITVIRPSLVPLSSRITPNPIVAAANAPQPDFYTASWAT